MTFDAAGTYLLMVTGRSGDERASARVTVFVSDDGGPTPPGSSTVSVKPDVKAEGQNLVFKVVLSKPAADDVVVSFSSQDVTAVAGVDFVGRKGEITIPKGKSMAYIGVPTHTDRVTEGSETMRLTLTSVKGASIDVKSGSGTITD